MSEMSEMSTIFSYFYHCIILKKIEIIKAYLSYNIK